MAKWESAKKAAKEAGNSNFLKLEDGQKVVLAIRPGDPVVKETYFDQTEKKSYHWTDEHKKLGHKKSTKFEFQVFNLSAGKPQVLGVSPKVFNAIVAADDKYDTAKAAFEFGRKGKGMNDTEYSFLFDHALTDDEKKTIAAAPLVKSEDDAEADGGASDLNSYEKEEKAEEAKGPLDADTQATIKGRLKPAGKEKAAEYLKELGASKVSDIPAAKKKQALELLEKYSPSAPAAEEDPFA